MPQCPSIPSPGAWNEPVWLDRLPLSVSPFERSPVEQRSGDPLTVDVGVAVHQLGHLRALVVEVQVVLAAEADAAVQLIAGARHPAQRIADPRLRPPDVGVGAVPAA